MHAAKARGPRSDAGWHPGLYRDRMDIEVIAFDVFGTLVDWRSSIAEALARVGGQAGLKADWPLVAAAWRSRYRSTLDRQVRGEAPFQALDVLHRIMLDEVAEQHGLQALTDS